MKGRDPVPRPEPARAGPALAAFLVAPLVLGLSGCGGSARSDDRTQLVRLTRTIVGHFKNRQFEKVLPLYAREVRRELDEVTYLKRQRDQAAAMTNMGSLFEAFHVVEDHVEISGGSARVPVYFKIRRIKGESVIKVRRFDLTFHHEDGDWKLLAVTPTRGIPPGP